MINESDDAIRKQVLQVTLPITSHVTGLFQPAGFFGPVCLRIAAHANQGLAALYYNYLLEP